jgi:diacylglycerol kinase (ATP)
VKAGTYLGARARSFVHAGAGIGAMFRTQPNARIHAAVTVVIVSLGVGFDLTSGEWCWLVLSIFLVLAAECFNTAFEALADAAAPDPHPLVGRAKDAAAGAVLLSAIGAAVIGLLVLGPHALESLRGM